MTFKSNKVDESQKHHTEQKPPSTALMDIFQDPQWMTGTMESTECYIHCFFLCIHTYDKV